MSTACLKQAFVKVAVNRPGKFSRSKQSRSNVPPKYVTARRFFARRSVELGRILAFEIFLTSLQTAFFNNLLESAVEVDPESLVRYPGLSAG